MKRAYSGIALVVAVGLFACGGGRAPKEPPASVRPPITILPACVGVPLEYKIGLLQAYANFPRQGKKVVVGPCRGECGFVVYLGSEGGPVPDFPTSVEGKPVCVEEGEPPKF